MEFKDIDVKELERDTVEFLDRNYHKWVLHNNNGYLEIFIGDDEIDDFDFIEEELQTIRIEIAIYFADNRDEPSLVREEIVNMLLETIEIHKLSEIVDDYKNNEDLIISRKLVQR